MRGSLRVVVVIIGILAAIALPNFIGAQKKAKLSGVKANMHTTQLCAESYGTDSGGTYGAAFAAIMPYFPGGGNTIGGAAGTIFKNPLSSVANGAGASTATTSATIRTERTSTAAIAAAQGVAGDVGYSGFNSGAAGGVAGALDTYAVDGADDAKNMVMGNNGHLVLSNQ
jgi:type II secretory pathway pseudopilin PulG